MDNRSRRPVQSQRHNPQGHNTVRPASSGRPPVRKRRKKKKNLLPALVLGIIGVVIIALIIMGVKSLFEGKPEEEKSPESSSILDFTPPPTPTPKATPTPPPAPTPAKEADITGLEVQQQDDMVMVGDAAYEYYKYDKNTAESYISAINGISKKAKGIADVYDIIIPTSIDVMLPLDFLNDYADYTSDQQKASAYILSAVDKSVKGVPVFDALKSHCDNPELYFKSDNHITGLSAYYIYREWALAKGLTPVELADCEKKTYEGFIGNLANGIDALSKGENLTVYEPPFDLSYEQLTDSGVLEPAAVFPDASSYDSYYKYNAFLGGSSIMGVITNADAKDDSSCVLVIDSNGTAIAPYIASHYKNVYVIDYRIYGQSATALAQEKGAKDIIVCTSITATRESSLVDGLNNVA